MPKELPGTEAEPIQAPPFDAATQEKRSAVLDKLYNPMASTSGSPPGPQASSELLDLAGLQNLAMSNSPVLRIAAADVESKRGLAIQAGAYPNPELGYEADTINTNNTAG